MVLIKLNITDSEDGLTWTIKDLPSTANGWPIAIYANGLFIVGDNAENDSIYRSSDGETWTYCDSTTIRSVAYGSSGFMGIQLNGQSIYSSADGITWSYKGNIGPTDDDHWEFIAYGDGKYVVLSDEGSNMAQSTDGGTTWIEVNSSVLSGDIYPTGLYYFNGEFIITTEDNGE